MGYSIGSYQRKTTYRRFWEKVVNGPNGCWNWSGPTQANGYCQFKLGGGGVLVHRHAYETMVGPLVDGLTIDHLCRNRICVNPQHLEQVSYRENVMRGDTLARENFEKTHCKYGHEFTEKNTYVMVDKRGRKGRSCRQCGHRKNKAHRFVQRLKQSIASGYTK